jgi:transposase
MKTPTINDFQKRFPDDATCLEHLMRCRYGASFECPSCNREAKYYRVKARRCYECEHCGNQVYPMAGTPFENTRTSLKDWFYVMFLFCASRNGVAAKEVQRQLGVTYKTAWRMCRLIREYMGYVDGDAPMGGEDGHSPVVEIDHAFVGGHDEIGHDDKHVVLGMLERGGEVIARQVASHSAMFAIPQIRRWVHEGTKVATDTGGEFRALATWGYDHATVNHSAGEYVRGPVHTNGIESFWSMLKRGINGTYIHVSSKHLQKYLWEFEYRHNLRKSPHLMFELLVRSFPRFDPTPWPPVKRQTAA